MFQPELAEDLSRWTRAALRDIFQPLADTLSCIYSRGKIEQPLISGRILDYSFGFSVDCQDNRPLGPLKLLHHLHGMVAKGGKRLNVFLYVEHERPSGTGILTYLPRERNPVDGQNACSLAVCA